MQLYILRQGGGQSLQIHLLGIQPNRLHKRLMARLLGKTHHLVLDARTVPWTHPFDHSAVQRRAMDILPDDFMGRFVGVGDVADHLIF